MEFKLKQVKACSDDSYDYDVEGTFPIKFKDFVKWIMQNKKYCYRVNFTVTNKCYGGAFKNELGMCNNYPDKMWRLTKREPENLYDQIADKEIIGCRANVGWVLRLTFALLKRSLLLYLLTHL